MSKRSRLLSQDRPTFILTYILEKIAQKERDAEKEKVDRQKDTIKVLADSETGQLIPVAVPALPAAQADWLDSAVLLESLVDEEDTVHMELSILFRAVCDVSCDKLNYSMNVVVMIIFVGGGMLPLICYSLLFLLMQLI